MSNPYAHPDYAALLAAVRAEPAADLPRLVLADWLDENGEPDRAEYVRDACAFHRAEWCPCVPASRCRCNGCRLEHRLSHLLYAHAKEWVTPFRRPWTGLSIGDHEVTVHGDGAAWEARLTFRRGFVYEMALPASQWVQAGDALLAREPVQSVLLRDTDVSWASADEWAEAFADSRTDPDGYFGGDPAPDHLAHVALFAGRWPGVTFTLPRSGWPMSPPSTPLADLTAMRARLERMELVSADDLGLPPFVSRR